MPSSSDHPTSTFVLAGVIGWPVAHSRSPLLHGHWIAEHGLTGAYLPLAVAPGRLEAALRGLPALGFTGCNVTIPHKVEAMRRVDRLEPLAQRIGAVNTIVVAPDGSLEGRNTDAFGFVHSLLERQPAWRADAGPALVLGAGGAARAIVAGLVDAGAREIRVLNRTPERAAELAAELQPADGSCRVYALPWALREEALAGCALLVNTTSQGMHGQPPLALRLDALPPHAVVSDAVYVPLDTPLLAAARTRGNPVVDGLGMLLHQARPAFAAWFGVMPEVTPALRAKLESTL
jgi:shikimate dehydrogenase